MRAANEMGKQTVQVQVHGRRGRFRGVGGRGAVRGAGPGRGARGVLAMALRLTECDKQCRARVAPGSRSEVALHDA